MIARKCYPGRRPWNPTTTVGAAALWMSKPNGKEMKEGAVTLSRAGWKDAHRSMN